MRVLITILFLRPILVYGVGDDESRNTIEDSHHSGERAERYKLGEDLLARMPRFLSFNKDSNKLRVEASFAVPLLSIPIGGETTDIHEGNAAVTVPKVDINLKSVITVASIFLLTFVILPKFLRLYSPVSDSHNRYSGDTSMLDDAAHLLSDTVERYNVDLESCSKKAFCWTMDKLVTRIEEGEASGPGKLLDPISSVPYLKHLFGDAWLWSLTQKIIFFRNNAENKRNCEQFDQKCLITSKGINLAAQTLLTSLKSKKL